MAFACQKCCGKNVVDSEDLRLNNFKVKNLTCMNGLYERRQTIHPNSRIILSMTLTVIQQTMRLQWLACFHCWLICKHSAYAGSKSSTGCDNGDECIYVNSTH